MGPIMRAPLFALPLALFATQVLAVGWGNETPPTPTETTTTCEEDQIYDAEKKECVSSDVQSLNDDASYDAVRELAYAGAHDRALKLMDTAQNQDDPRFLIYRGFIARQKGQMDTAMTFYKAALDADPDYLLARAYMGMGLVTLGNKPAAKAQLTEISARGGKGTWAYISLKKAVSDGTLSDY